MATSERRMKRGKRRRLSRAEVLVREYHEMELELRRRAVRAARAAENLTAASLSRIADTIHEKWAQAVAAVEAERGKD